MNSDFPWFKCILDLLSWNFLAGQTPRGTERGKIELRMSPITVDQTEHNGLCHILIPFAAFHFYFLLTCFTLRQVFRWQGPVFVGRLRLCGSSSAAGLMSWPEGGKQISPFWKLLNYCRTFRPWVFLLKSRFVTMFGLSGGLRKVHADSAHLKNGLPSLSTLRDGCVVGKIPEDQPVWHQQTWFNTQNNLNSHFFSIPMHSVLNFSKLSSPRLHAEIPAKLNPVNPLPVAAMWLAN